MTTTFHSAGLEKPRIQIPQRACDCHMHLYDAQFQAAPGATLLPPDATIDQYRALQKRIGTQRTVLVTPSTYGTDNRCMLAGLAELGEHARGVAVIDGTETDACLQELHAAGVRGVRLNLSLGVVGSIDSLIPLAERIEQYGWHIQLLMSADQLAKHESVLQQLSVPLVLDHFARLNPENALTHPAYQLVLRLLYEEKAWVKLSGGYIISETRSTADPALDRLARSFIENAPHRLVWGSDWPHATALAGLHALPDDAAQLDRLGLWAQDAQTLQQILVTNAESLYGFGA